MDSLDLIKTFNEVAAKGSFSLAAKKLGISKATASKYVAELESRFGVRLLNRSTRSVSLTDAGSLLLERSKPLLEMAESTQAEVQGRATAPAGRLRISAPHGIERSSLPALLAEFMGYYPDVTLSVQLENQMVDLAEGGFDMVLRFGPVIDANLIVRRLLPASLVVCATPAYWNKHGRPSTPDDLAAHDALTLSADGPHPHWHFQSAGRPVAVEMRSRMDASDFSVLVPVALRGIGVLYAPELLVQPHIESGELEAVLHEHMRGDLWMSAAYLQRRHNSAALRALLDFLETRIKARGLGEAIGSRNLSVNQKA